MNKGTQKVTINDKIYTNQGNGYYGVSVVPGSTDDNTIGKIGIHLEYLQYADKSNPYVIELLTIALPAFTAAEKKTKEENRIKEDKEIERLSKQSKPKKNYYQSQLCPHCHSVCYGDCQS